MFVPCAAQDAFDKAFAWQQGQQQLQDEQAEQQQQAAELSPEVSEKVADASSIQSAESAAGASLSSVNKLMPDSPPSSHQLAVKRPPTGTAATLIFDSECDTSEQQLPQGASQQGNAVSASRPGAQNAHAAQLEQHAAQPGCSQHDQLSTHGHTGQTVPVEQQAANSGAACVEEPGLRSTTGCSGSTQCAWCGRSAVD